MTADVLARENRICIAGCLLFFLSPLSLNTPWAESLSTEVRNVGSTLPVCGECESKWFLVSMSALRSTGPWPEVDPYLPPNVSWDRLQTPEPL